MSTGRGHFAVVKLARHVFTGEKVAVKVIDKTKLDEISRAHLFQEVLSLLLSFGLLSLLIMDIIYPGAVHEASATPKRGAIV